MKWDAQIKKQRKAAEQAARTKRPVYDGTTVWYPPGPDGVPIAACPSPDRIKTADCLEDECLHHN